MSGRGDLAVSPIDERAARRWLFAIVLIAVAVYIASIDATAAWDDSLVYLVGAKSLAEGHGYRLLNLPGAPSLRMYPPAFPAMLSVLWRLSPDYPSNLPLLKSVGVIAAAAFALIAAALLWTPDRERGLVVVAAAMVLFHSDVVQLVGSTVFSDPVFAAAAALVLLLLDRELADARDRVSLRAFGLALGAAVGILIRALGVVPWLVSVAGLAWRRSWRRAALVAAFGVLACAWFAVSTGGRTGPPKRVWMYGGMTSYSDMYRYAASADGTLRPRSLLEMATAAARQEMVGTWYLLREGLALGRTGWWFERLVKAPEIAVRTMALLAGLLVAALTLAGAVMDWRRHPSALHVALVVTWLIAATLPASASALPRYVMPFGVFLSYFFLLGARRSLERLWAWPAARATWAAAAVGAVLVALSLAFAGRHIFNLHGPGAPRGTYYATVEERREAYRWIEANVRPDELVAAHYAGEVYLVTGRRAEPFVTGSIPDLRGDGVRWVLAGVDDNEDASAALASVGATERWHSQGARFRIYLLGSQ
jgi:hypothetical protein